MNTFEDSKFQSHINLVLHHFIEWQNILSSINITEPTLFNHVRESTWKGFLANFITVFNAFPDMNRSILNLQGFFTYLQNYKKVLMVVSEACSMNVS
jgi:hypothetical protein